MDAQQTSLQAKRATIIGCGSIGGPVSRQLAMAGVGTVRLIDHETLVWANVGRHVLGAEHVGQNKADALAAVLGKSFPHAVFESRGKNFAQVLAEEPDMFAKSDLVVCATANWSVESSLNLWHVKESQMPRVVYTWTEPHACAGHAVAISRADACFQCGCTTLGEANLKVTDWPNGSTERGEPACGAMFQPYGPVEVSWTVSLAAALALDCLLGKVEASTHRIWAGPQLLLRDAGGIWSASWLQGRAGREGGGFLEERAWDKSPACVVCA